MNCSPEYVPKSSSPESDDTSKAPERIIRFVEAKTGKIRFGQPVGGSKAELVSGFDSIFANGDDSARKAVKPTTARLTGEIVTVGEVLAPIPKPPMIYGWVLLRAWERRRP